LFKIATNSSGVTSSLNEEKLLISVNNAVICFSSPPSFKE